MQNVRRSVLISFASALVVGAGLNMAATGAAHAADWPTKPITIVVAYPAGGDTDAVARLLGEKLSTRLGQPVVVDNKPGASGIIGTSFVDKAHPDGYTLLMAPSTVTMAQLVVKASPSTHYDVGALTPIIKVGEQPMFLAAGSAGPKTTALAVKESQQAPLNYASPGTGSPMHILGEIFNRASGAKFIHIPYKGIAPALTDVVGGHVPLTWITYGPVEPYLKDGKIRLLGVAQAERSPLAPDLPTLAEQGYKDVEVVAWNGLFGPKGLPVDIVTKLNTELDAIIRDPEIGNRLRTLGMLPAGGPPEALRKTAITDLERFTKVVNELGITAN